MNISNTHFFMSNLLWNHFINSLWDINDVVANYPNESIDVLQTFKDLHARLERAVDLPEGSKTVTSAISYVRRIVTILEETEDNGRGFYEKNIERIAKKIVDFNNAEL